MSRGGASCKAKALPYYDAIRYRYIHNMQGFFSSNYIGVLKSIMQYVSIGFLRDKVLSF